MQNNANNIKKQYAYIKKYVACSLLIHVLLILLLQLMYKRNESTHHSAPKIQATIGLNSADNPQNKKTIGVLPPSQSSVATLPINTMAIKKTDPNLSVSPKNMFGEKQAYQLPALPEGPISDEIANVLQIYGQDMVLDVTIEADGHISTATPKNNESHIAIDQIVRLLQKMSVKPIEHHGKAIRVTTSVILKIDPDLKHIEATTTPQHAINILD